METRAPGARIMEKFKPQDHLIQLKSKQGTQDYLPVAWRLVWFRQDNPDGTIETELVHLDLDKDTEEESYVWNNEKRRSEKVIKMGKGIAVFKATIADGKGGIATGTKMEKAAAFPDYLEKAETGSIGRALAALGYGTQFAPEMNEAHRIVDAPVERPEPSHNGGVEATKPVSIDVPTSKTLYEQGGKKGLWKSSQEFYAAVSAMLSVPVGKDTKLTPEERIALAKQIDEAA